MTSIKLYQRKKQLNNDLYPIVLRVTHLRKNNIISLNFKCRQEDWNAKKEEFRKSMPDYKNQNILLHTIKNRAEQIIRNYEFKEIDFDFKQFKNDLFHYKRKSSESLFDFWKEHIHSLIESKRVGSAKYYKDCMDSFLHFVKNEDFSFKDINYNSLNDYENYLRKRDCVPNGIAVRMRGIRAIYNEAIKKGIANSNDYPFRKYKISKLKSSVDKRALTFEEVSKIKELDLTNYPHLINARNYFVFSYHSMGMNFYDMMLLEWSNITKDSIIYVRHKTKARIIIKRTKSLNDILDYYKEHALDTKYVFPILLKDNLTSTQIFNRKHKTLAQFNKALKELASLCEIDKNITSYVARHSFATNLKHKGVPTDVISEAMKHKTLAVTQAYLKDFGYDIVADAVSVLET